MNCTIVQFSALTFTNLGLSNDSSESSTEPSVKLITVAWRFGHVSQVKTSNKPQNHDHEKLSGNRFIYNFDFYPRCVSFYWALWLCKEN